MEEQKTRGILLSAIQHLGKKKILKVLTPEAGLVSLFVNVNALSSLCIPFLLGEWVYHVKTTSDLHLLKDASIVNDLAHLRDDYERLMSAGKIAQMVLSSQQAGKPSPKLYELTLFYLQKLNSFPNPRILTASFCVKLLLHEGLLHCSDTCMSCGAPTTHLSQGESVCSLHKEKEAIAWTEHEWQSLKTLGSARRLVELQGVAWTESLQKKIDLIFSTQFYKVKFII